MGSVRARVSVSVSACGVGGWGVMEEAWEEMKQSISLANRLNKTNEEVTDFHEKLKGALHSAVSQCRMERKRKLAEAPKLDLSDENMLHAARFTDNLPLADYAQILHLVPRLVNVVTASTCAQPRPTHTRRQNAVLPPRPLRSWPRPSPCRAAGSRCLWTCTPSPRGARTRTMLQNDSPRSRLPLTNRAVACLSSVSRKSFLTTHTQQPPDKLLTLFCCSCWQTRAASSAQVSSPLVPHSYAP